MPLGEYMRAVLQSNTRKKRKGYFDNTTPEHNDTHKGFTFDDTTATPEELIAIRRRIKKRKRNQIVIALVLTSILLVLICCVVVYVF